MESQLLGSVLVVGSSLLFTVVVAGLVLSGGPGRADNRSFFAHTLVGLLHHLVASWIYVFPHDAAEFIHGSQLDATLDILGLYWLYATVLFAYAFPTARVIPLRLWAPVGLAVTGASVLRFYGDPTVGLWAFRLAGGPLIAGILFFLFSAPGRTQRRDAQGGIRLVQWVMFSRLLLALVVHNFGSHQMEGVNRLLLDVEMVLAPPLTSALFAYALLRYQLLDIRGFITRSIGLFTVTALSGVLLVGLLELLQRMFRALDLPVWGEGALAAPGLVILLMLAFNPVKLKLEALLERRVNRGLIRARRAATRYHAQSEGTLDITDLLAALTNAVDGILPGSAAAVCVSRPSPCLLRTPGFGLDSPPGSPSPSLPFPEGPQAARLLHDHGLRWWAKEDEEHILKEGAAPFTRLGANVVIPFMTRDDAPGALLLQAPAWEVERLQLLKDMARTLGLQMENALLFQEVVDANDALQGANDALAELHGAVEAIVDSLPVGLLVLGVDGEVERHNPTLTRLTGISSQGDAVGPLLASLGDLDAISQAPGQILRRTLSPAPDAPHQPLEVNARVAPLYDQHKRLRGRLILLSDVTHVIRLEREVETSQRLAALGQLAAAMAHEIRTPLTSIKMNTQILGSRLTLSERDAEYLDIILEELERLNRYVSEILDYARPLKLATAPLDLAELVGEVKRGLFFLMAERGITLEVDARGESQTREAQVDGERLKQVLINLLDNAAQAMEGDGEAPVQVIIEAAPDPSGASGVAITVVDQGQGIAPEHLERLFEPFFTTRPTGTGLGLAIAQRITTSHGGSLSAKSDVGKGSRFTLWVPTTQKGQVSSPKAE